MKSKCTSEVAAIEPGAPCKDYTSTVTVLFDAILIEMTSCYGERRKRSF